MGLPCICNTTPHPPSAFSRYTVNDIGTISDPALVPGRINKHGTSIAISKASPQSPARSYYLRHGRWHPIEAMGADSTFARDLNSRGQVVGYARAADGLHAFVWQHHKLYYLDRASTHSFADGINDRGQIVGSLRLANRTVACTWVAGKRQTLNVSAKSDSHAIGINVSGDIVGSTTLDRSNDVSVRHAFLYRHGKVFDLGTLAGRISSEAIRINARGDILGNAFDDREGSDSVSPHGFLWQRGKMIDLVPLSGFAASHVEDFNDRGEVVGYVRAASKRDDDSAMTDQPLHDRFRAFLYLNGRMNDLNTLIAAKTGWTLEMATGINKRGQIVGVGTFKGNKRAFLLTPIVR